MLKLFYSRLISCTPIFNVQVPNVIFFIRQYNLSIFEDYNQFIIFFILKLQTTVYIQYTYIPKILLEQMLLIALGIIY